MTAEEPGKDVRIPLVEEEVDVAKRVVETGSVRVRTRVDERTETVRETVNRDDVDVQRVLIDRIVEFAPEVRQEGDTIIIPVVEEVLVVSRQLRLKEELHVRRRLVRETVEQPVTLRSIRAEVETESKRDR